MALDDDSVGQAKRFDESLFQLGDTSARVIHGDGHDAGLTRFFKQTPDGPTGAVQSIRNGTLRQVVVVIQLRSSQHLHFTINVHVSLHRSTNLRVSDPNKSDWNKRLSSKNKTIYQ